MDEANRGGDGCSHGGGIRDAWHPERPGLGRTGGDGTASEKIIGSSPQSSSSHLRHSTAPASSVYTNSIRKPQRSLHYLTSGGFLWVRVRVGVRVS